MPFLLRWSHAWAWTALGVWLIGSTTHAYPVSFFSALFIGAILTPGVYLPLVLATREREPDLTGELSGPLAVAVAGGVISFVMLGGFSLLGSWDKRPKGATMMGVMVSVLALHLLALVCIAFSERMLLPSREEP